MRSLSVAGWCLLSAGLAHCTGVDRTALGADSSAAGTADQVVAPDLPSAPEDSGIPVDGGTAPVLDADPLPVDAGSPVIDIIEAVDVPPPPPDRGPPLPDVPAPVDVRPAADVATCPGCPEPMSAPRFCPASDRCQPMVGCRERCGVCLTPELRGDTCATALVLGGIRGTHRALLTTCGARDNLSVGCNRTGNDIVLGIRVPTRGRVRASLTVPPGATLNFGYSNRNEACVDMTSSRPCNDATPRQTQGFDATLEAGLYWLFVLTSTPATVVVDLELP